MFISSFFWQIVGFYICRRLFQQKMHSLDRSTGAWANLAIVTTNNDTISTVTVMGSFVQPYIQGKNCAFILLFNVLFAGVISYGGLSITIGSKI